MSSLDAVADDAGGLGLQAHQLLDRLRRLPLGPRLEVAAEQDQGDDDHGRLEVDLGLEAGPAGALEDRGKKVTATL